LTPVIAEGSSVQCQPDYIVRPYLKEKKKQLKINLKRKWQVEKRLGRERSGGSKVVDNLSCPSCPWRKFLDNFDNMGMDIRNRNCLSPFPTVKQIPSLGPLSEWTNSFSCLGQWHFSPNHKNSVCIFFPG
jgi:hypothetical protein